MRPGGSMTNPLASVRAVALVVALGMAGTASGAESAGDVAEPGLALESALEWRPRLHQTYGITLEYAEMGGDPDLESSISTATGGAVDEVRHRQWGASVTARYLIRPDHRVVPFIRTSLGARSFSTSLRGPAADGSKSALALAQDLGLGVIVRLGKAVSADLSGGYTRVTKGESTTTAGAANFSSKGTMQYLQFRGGLMRRFGGGKASD